MSKATVFILFLQMHLAAMSSVFVAKLLESTSKGHWEAILFGCLLEFLLVWLYVKGLSACPGKNISEIIREAAGVWTARLVLAPFIIYLFVYVVSTLRYQVIQINVVLLSDTPLWATSLLYLLLSLYAAVQGLQVIARMSVALFIVFMPFVMLSLFVGYQNFDFQNIFPVWDTSLRFLARPPYYVSLLAFSGFLVLGMLPSKEPAKMRLLWPALLMIVVFGLSFVYAPLLIFGQEPALLLQFPAVMASDTVDLEWVVFDWLPAFFVVSSSALGILEAAVFLWMATVMIKKLFVPLNEKWIASIVCAAIYWFIFQIPNMHALNRYYSFLAPFFFYSVMAVPLATFFASLRTRRSSS